MENNLVSVIIPIFNGESYIKEAVDSVLSQTYKNIEVIIVDDGSTDRTGEIVKDIIQHDRRIRYIYQENKGQSAARNTAIDNAKGKYIAFLDADDVFLPTKIEKQVSYMELHPDCDLCYCKIYHFYNNFPEKLFYFSLEHPSGYLFENLLRKNFINPLSVVVKKEVLDKFGAFEPTFRRLDEQYLWLKLSFHKVKFCYLDESLAKYRVFKGSLSNESSYFQETEEKFFELLKIIKTWLNLEEQKRMKIDRLINRTRFRIFVGKLMNGNSIFAKTLFKLYNLKRKNRFQKIL